MLFPTFRKVILPRDFFIVNIQRHYFQEFKESFSLALKYSWIRVNLYFTIFFRPQKLDWIRGNIHIIAQSGIKLSFLLQRHAECESKLIITCKLIRISKCDFVRISWLLLEPGAADGCIISGLVAITFVLVKCFVRIKVAFLWCRAITEWVWIESDIGRSYCIARS